MSKKATKEYRYTDTIPHTPLRFAYFAAKQYGRWGIVAILAVTIAQLSGVFLPFVLRQIINAALGSSHSHWPITVWITLFPILVFTSYAFYRLSGFVGMIWLARTESFSYNLLFEYLSRHSYGYFNDRFAGSISNKVSHASEGTFRLLDGTLWGHYGAVLNLIVSGVLIFTTNLWVGLIYTALVMILIPMNVWLTKIRRPHVVAFAGQRTRLRGRTVDVITNISATRQYARHSFEYEHIAREVDVRQQLDLKQWRLSEWALVFNNVVIGASITAMIVVMYHFWLLGVFTVGDFVLVLSLVMNLQGTLIFIGNAMNQFIRLYGDVEEGLDEILLEHDIVDATGAAPLETTVGAITWQDVQFHYEGNPVFTNFDLTIQGGQRVGLVGASGAGKSTFVSLLLRQHELNGGAILIDGQDIAAVTQDSLREAISVVPQEPMLFHRSIRENIAYGNPGATDTEIIAVATQAQAHDFITALPDGYNTLVGERGVKLSGGQKQRIAIARAMLKDAPILVLDEATSALDSESEVAIQQALRTLMDKKTVIAVAHRLSTLREMDRIIVLDKGAIVEDGDHKQLKQNGGIYQRLWEHQAGGFVGE